MIKKVKFGFVEVHVSAIDWVAGPMFKKFKPVSNQTYRVRKVTRACVWGSAGFNRQNDVNGGVWVRFDVALKLEKGMSTCYRLGMGSPVQKVVTREATRSPEANKLPVRVSGAVQVLTEKMMQLEEFGSVGV